MNFPNDPFFEGVARPAVPMFPHIEFGHRARREESLGLGGGMLMPFGGPSPFSMMNGMMMNMDHMMRNMERMSGGGHGFSSSSTTVMHYSSDGQGGRPHVYQATSSTRQGPGGVRETRKAVKDSQTGIQKMAIGHHIGDRSHVIERRVNARTGERAENQEFINLDDSEADTFSSEWREKTQTLNHALHPRLEQSHRNQFSNSRGLPSSSQHPQNPVATRATVLHDEEPEVFVSGVSYPERDRERREGGKSNKRKHRSTSSSGEEGGSVSITKRSPKFIRTKSPPYVPKTSVPPQSQFHSSHTHHQSDIPSARPHIVGATGAHTKNCKKKTT